VLALEYRLLENVSARSHSNVFWHRHVIDLMSANLFSGQEPMTFRHQAEAAAGSLVKRLLVQLEAEPMTTGDGITELTHAPSIVYDPWLDLSSREALRASLRKSVRFAIEAHTKGVHGRDATMANIYDLRRAAWQALCPLRRDSIVLDFGCGLGALSRSLARNCHAVVALDACYERLMVHGGVNRECGITNVAPVFGDAQSLSKFRPASFDGIVLNGVLEWLPEAIAGEPRAIQLDFLRACRRILKADGWLYLGIENRWGFRYFLGRRDEHVNLLFSSLMPRWLADAYSKALRGRPYRTYTYGRRATESLLKEAGFESIRTYAPTPDYRHFELLLPLDADPRAAAVAARLGIGKRWKKRLVESPLFYRSFAPCLGMVASPKGSDVPLWCQEFNKGFGFLNHVYVKYDQASFWYRSDDYSWRVRELSLSEEADDKLRRVARLAQFLRRLSDCPQALQQIELHGSQGFVWLDRPMVAGRLLAEMRPAEREQHWEEVFGMLRHIQGMGSHIDLRTQELAEVVADYAPNAKEALPTALYDLLSRLLAKLHQHFGNRKLLMHGDCSAKNIVITARGAQLIDWEWYRVVNFPAYDILKLVWFSREDPKVPDFQRNHQVVDDYFRDDQARSCFHNVHPGEDWTTGVTVYWVLRIARSIGRFRHGGMPSDWISRMVEPVLVSLGRMFEI
jgi:SAM-dependent methyltransferase/thiamine kinase-like enzyme